MGIDAGFDMVPRLSKGTADTQLWARFINAVKEHYKDDAQVEVTPNYILFKVGEHPNLPFEGHKFLRFSSKVSGQSRAWSYIDTVTGVAKANFGSRVQYWNEALDQSGRYNWREVHESIRSYDQVCILFSFSFFSSFLFLSLIGSRSGGTAVSNFFDRSRRTVRSSRASLPALQALIRRRSSTHHYLTSGNSLARGKGWSLAPTYPKAPAFSVRSRSS
jgi:hypothetical protein